MVNKKFFEALEETIRNDEEGVRDYLDACAKQEAHIELHNNYGNTTCKINGTGPLLFDSACTILKALALEESRKNGIDAGEYVRFVAEMVIYELGLKSTPKEYGPISPDDVDL